MSCSRHAALLFASFSTFNEGLAHSNHGVAEYSTCAVMVRLPCMRISRAASPAMRSNMSCAAAKGHQKAAGGSASLLTGCKVLKDVTWMKDSMMVIALELMPSSCIQQPSDQHVLIHCQRRDVS